MDELSLFKLILCSCMACVQAAATEKQVLQHFVDENWYVRVLHFIDENLCVCGIV